MKEKLMCSLAKSYKPNSLWSLGGAQDMLIRQYNFPYTFNSNETILTDHSDRADPQYFKQCFGEIGVAEHTCEYWLRGEKLGKILTFLKKIMKADEKINWTGFRVLGSVTERGSTVFTWQLFAKDPKSDTEVYTGEQQAPNVIKN